MLLILILFSLNASTNIICKIIFPIETLPLDNYIISSNISSHKITMLYSLRKKFYTFLEIGTPIQKVPLFIDTRENTFEITSFSRENIINYHLVYNLSSIFNKYDFFKENKSSTFKTDGCIKSNNMFDDHLYDCFSYETINLYKENKIEIKNFGFNMVKNKEENITGILGLGLFDKKSDISKSFLKILKDKNIINNYNWYFLFNSWNETNGKLILGSLPHEDYPNIFSEDDLEYTYIPLDDYSFSHNSYKIEFNEIKINSEINLLNVNAELNFDSNVIIANKEFETELRKKFIKNLIIEEKCFKDTVKQNIYYINDLIYYYCEVNTKFILYDYLPSIKFISKDLNYTFEITKDELYKIDGDYIYLNILFDYGKNYWILGKPISLKYPFVFNQDSKKIGLYKNYNKKKYINEKRENNNINIIKIFLVLFFSIVLLLIGFYLGKTIYKMKRKIRANELNDNYEYINDTKNQNDNKNYSIEMKIKL